MFFVMSLVSTPENYYKVVQKDMDNAYLAYGEEGGKEIVLNANSAFGMIFTETAANKAVNKMHNTPHKSAAFFGSEQKAAAATNDILKTFKLEIYALFLRVSIAWRWIPVLFVFGFAAFVDGLVARKIKIEGYGFTSPGVQARVANISVVVTGLSMMSLYLPINLPVLWWPVATLIAVVCTRYVASNMKQITT
jgi:hypothetical protein